MPASLRGLAALVSLLVCASATASFSDDEIRIGVLTDLSGVSAGDAGQLSIIAAEVAADRFGGEINGTPIRIIGMDHGSDSDQALKAARELVEEHNVDMITDLVRSNTAVPVQRYATEQGVIVMPTGGGASSLHGEHCSPLAFHWGFDSFALANAVVSAVVDQGGESWFFVTADYAFGQAIESAATGLVRQAGGEVAGAARYAYKTTDLTEPLTEARRSQADVIGLASGGEDTQKAIRQGYELGLMDGERRFAALLMFITDVRDLGLYVAEGLQLATPYYWDRDEASRELALEVQARSGAMPTMIHAGTFSATLNYLRAAASAGTDEPGPVARTLDDMDIEDAFSRNGYVREDGLMVHDFFLMEAKSPLDSRTAWDYYEEVTAIPGEAIHAAPDGSCEQR
ncbi:ABC transporter substrate-binding protein [Arhodomonas sp. SL1]|uniref:ABC transporter substrate-binding protein n=1 Tax=Arhodomonas sp. SL1 TaxID=3425691 RepID=UPI003F885730